MSPPTRVRLHPSRLPKKMFFHYWIELLLLQNFFLHLQDFVGSVKSSNRLLSLPFLPSRSAWVNSRPLPPRLAEKEEEEVKFSLFSGLVFYLVHLLLHHVLLASCFRFDLDLLPDFFFLYLVCLPQFCCSRSCLVFLVRFDLTTWSVNAYIGPACEVVLPFCPLEPCVPFSVLEPSSIGPWVLPCPLPSLFPRSSIYPCSSTPRSFLLALLAWALLGFLLFSRAEFPFWLGRHGTEFVLMIVGKTMLWEIFRYLILIGVDIWYLGGIMPRTLLFL